MKHAFFLGLALLAPAFLQAQEFSTASMRPITLGEAYSLSIARSEALAIQGQGIKELEAAERLLKASFRPSFDFTLSQYKQQNSKAATQVYVSGGYELFSGMRDYISVKAAAATTEAAGLDLARARQELYLDVARTYLDLYAAQMEAVIRREQMAVTARRISELDARVDIGRSRKSESAAAKTQLAQDRASYLDALSAERAAQRVLMFLTGLDVFMAPAELAHGNDPGIEHYLKLVLQRPDLAARRRSLEASAYLADAAGHALWPSVTVSGDYYVLRHPKPRPADYWDALVALNQPLYTGGAARARRDAADYARRSAELALQLAERQALYEVRSAYDQFSFTAMRTASLKDALALAAENARYQENDYKLGLVTNLDVLSALNTVQQTRLALSDSKVQESLTLLRLKIAAGLAETKQ